MGVREITVVGGVDRIHEIRGWFQKSLEEYQKEVKEIKKGFVYAPRSWKTKEGVKTRYYWYKYVYKRRGGGTRYRTMKYVGPEKPGFNLPDPPENPLGGLEYKVTGNNILLDPKDYRKHRKLFKGLKTLTVK